MVGSKLNNKREISQVFELVKSGGWLMLPIIICSIVALAICLDRFLALNPDKIAPKQLLAQVWGWIKNNQLDAGKIKSLKTSSPLGRILAAGLSNSRHGREVMKESIPNDVAHDAGVASRIDRTHVRHVGNTVIDLVKFHNVIISTKQYGLSGNMMKVIVGRTVAHTVQTHAWVVGLVPTVHMVDVAVLHNMICGC